ncbi:hypothetical protein AVEN_91214-1, partial [Araneus ventricosus]
SLEAATSTTSAEIRHWACTEGQPSKLRPLRKTCGRLAERRMPSLNKAPEEGLKASALSGRENGLDMEGLICGVPCLMLVDTGTNEIRLARELKKRFIYTAPNISFKVSAYVRKPIFD